MDDLRNIVILSLAVGCLVLWHARGCNGPEAPAPAVKTQYVYDSTEVVVKVPVVQTRTKYVDIWHTDTVVRYAWKRDTVVVVDTMEVIAAWLHEEVEQELFHRDSNLEATLKVSIYQNMATGMQMTYKLLKPVEMNTVLHDRFQMHVGALVGVRTDLSSQWRPDLGLDALAEFKTGTSAGVYYKHAIGASDAHSMGFSVKQRLRFR